MIDFLLGVPGKLKTISDYLTTHLASTRAAKIDNLDAAISTRAVASTALSNVQWTNALATLLGNTIQTSVIQSIQTGYANSTATYTAKTNGAEDEGYRLDVTISSVNTAKSKVYIEGGILMNSGLAHSVDGACSARLTSATNLRISYRGSATTTGSVNIQGRWTVVEFK